MGDALIVRRGGASAFAFILVSYPAGSTVTCTNSSGKKDISSTQILFYVKKSTLPISCTVTATDGTHSKSQTVSITYEGQSETVNIQYTQYLYDAGNEYTDITGGWQARAWKSHSDENAGAPRLTKNAASMHISFADHLTGVVEVANDVSLAGYTKLCFNISGWNVKSFNVGLRCGIINRNESFFVTNAIAFVTPTAAGKWEVDLTGINLDVPYDIFLGASASSNGSAQIDVDAIWAE